MTSILKKELIEALGLYTRDDLIGLIRELEAQNEQLRNDYEAQVNEGGDMERELYLLRKEYEHLEDRHSKLEEDYDELCENTGSELALKIGAIMDEIEEMIACRRRES